MPDNKFKPYPKEEGPEEGHEQGPKGHHPPPPRAEIPPHILNEIFDLKEKVGRLEGQVEVLLRIKGK